MGVPYPTTVFMVRAASPETTSTTSQAKARECPEVNPSITPSLASEMIGRRTWWRNRQEV
ncbi:hypothetical protein FHS42_005856 [Streptomyces zagrosensis]|uniref:Uncharacterized protein n=1 Tax=Streptomyces zagrosensis TaxID=1042984 RepID=A0A7W9QEH4_9ACTN|nr:hypothetical protein [Streptomyces zagrosensis]